MEQNEKWKLEKYNSVSACTGCWIGQGRDLIGYSKSDGYNYRSVNNVE